eukprot:TRINITY_DN4862_c0_g1_i1.p1 TRINITY_DN4862_c0_g1~~TRINITY_DN4862_c0_g1_i1.p1  ORF type:complete len:634 (-),score=131.32 TRINITY_DN4862_c0_g1_i1:25-1926(-)
MEIDSILLLSCELSTTTEFRYILFQFTEATELGFDDAVGGVMLILGPTLTKGNKTVEEVSRSIGCLLNNVDVQSHLLAASDPQSATQALIDGLETELRNDSHITEPPGHAIIPPYVKPIVGGCLYRDIRKRLPTWPSDWTDAFQSRTAISKTVATSFFLYFACLLPAIAFGILNSSHTGGSITVAKTILAQGAGGLLFSIIAGQPMVILLSTAPISIYIKLIYDISVDNNVPFWSFYMLVGIFNGIFLCLYSVFGLSTFMRYSSRFVEEIFAVFITVAFLYDGIHPIYNLFQEHIYSCSSNPNYPSCDSGPPLVFLVLVVSTLWVCFKLARLRDSPYISAKFRGVFSDYALPMGVLIVTLLRYAILFPIDTPEFASEKDAEAIRSGDLVRLPYLESVSVGIYPASLGLGFLLSLLFFVDQNISAALANASEHHLKKWGGYHLDILLVGIINIILSILGLPWIHGALPHSALHVKSLSTVVSIKQGREAARDVFISVVETRCAAFLCHALMLVSLLLIPIPLTLIPVPVFYGVFWFLGISGLRGNQFWERLLLLITDQRLYPAAPGLRRISQRNIHIFTAVQIVCLLIFCFVSFFPNPYLTSAFPIIIVLLVPLRRLLLPRILPKEALRILDAY